MIIKAIREPWSMPHKKTNVIRVHARNCSFIEDLYEEILYEIANNIGCESSESLIEFTQEAFNISNERHEDILKTAEQKEPPSRKISVEGFIRNEKLTNLVISRPRCLLMIYGNPYLLFLDPRWRTIIKYCVDNDTYLGDLPTTLSDPPTLSEETVNIQDN
uniref:RNA helicase n=1 Tax=Glossina palpalis gambiensis TaxID=67801 RepID=A0A1B0BAL2_9MUSC